LARRPTRRVKAYKLTPQMAVEHGGPVLLLAPQAFGQHYKLFASRPGCSMNRGIWRDGLRSEVISPQGETLDINAAFGETPALIRVDVRGPVEQRASYMDECAAWTDGHDAIAERLCAALETSDVLLVIDSPGGAHAGLQESIKKVLECKERNNRHVTVYADEMIGSALYWWAAVVGDEIYCPESALVGSIGARAGHESIAGALEKGGIEVTYFAWPGEGKVAFAPELPLSDLGKQRGNRDVAVAGEAFAAAVGPRRGLKRSDIVSLDADVLHGRLALKKGLVDGVAGLEEVTQYALQLAEQGENQMASGLRAEAPPNPETPDDPNQDRRSEGEPDRPGQDPDRDPQSDRKLMECTNCGAANDDDAKFCDKCGTSMDDRLAQDDDDDDDDDDDLDDRAAAADDDDDDDLDDRARRADADEPDDDRRNHPPPPTEDRRRSSKMSLNAILGLREGSSVVAQKSAALSLRTLANAVMKATNTRSPDRALGAFRALAEDAAEVAKLRADMKHLRSVQNRAERMDLLKKLSAANLPGYSRGELFVDKEVNGKLVATPAPMFAEMKLATLRGLVSAKVKSGSPARRANPFQPNRVAAKTAATEARAKEIVQSGNFQNISTTASPESLARAAAALEDLGFTQPRGSLQ